MYHTFLFFTEHHFKIPSRLLHFLKTEEYSYILHKNDMPRPIIWDTRIFASLTKKSKFQNIIYA